MSKEEDNKAVVGRWFTEFWGKGVNLGVVDEIAAPDMLLKYSLHEPRRGRVAIPCHRVVRKDGSLSAMHGVSNANELCSTGNPRNAHEPRCRPA
jgi:hypothetical protein